ncbi:precorrin-3B C(17)-methyltransferase, partial [bacterium]|nr:precorrin-3B C(17)-methyltransferase [bacterium]
AQNVVLTTLSDMCGHDIGMLTTLIVGNSHTFAKDGLMVTPRGYENKYVLDTGEVLEGQKPGISLKIN